MKLINNLNHFICISLAVILTITTCAEAQHTGDIGLRVVNNTIESTSISARGYGVNERVFAAAFGDTGSPWFTSNPGYDALPGTFTTGSRIGFRFTGPILVWNGNDFVPTSPLGPLAGERLKVSYLTANATSSAGPTPGFDLAAQSDGGWHRHLSMTLQPATGSASPDVGVYVVPLQMYSTVVTIVPSETLWIVINGGASQETFDAALAAAIAVMNPPPCPWDLDGDESVGGGDLGLLLGNWGAPGPADFDNSGVVDGADLGALLGAWGACP